MNAGVFHAALRENAPLPLGQMVANQPVGWCWTID
jgi:hypothetical protein